MPLPRTLCRFPLQAAAIAPTAERFSPIEVMPTSA
jgi:hypothetical protein